MVSVGRLVRRELLDKQPLEARDLLDVLDVSEAAIVESALILVVDLSVSIEGVFDQLTSSLGEVFGLLIFNIAQFCRSFTQMVRYLAPEYLVHLALVDFSLHLGGHPLATDELEVLCSHLVERLSLLGAHSVKLTLLESLLREVFEQTHHFPARHARKLVFIERTQVEQLLLDSLLGQLAQVSIRACDLLGVLDSRVY